MLSLWQKRSLAIGYWQYWLHAVNQHALHAPFIYQFYQDVIRNRSTHSAFEAIEQYRRSLLASQENVTFHSMGAASQVDRSSDISVKRIARHSLSKPRFGRFLYHLTQFQQPRYIVELGTSLGVTTLYLSLAGDDCAVYTLEGCHDVATIAQQAFLNVQRPNIELREGNIDHTLPQLLQEIPQVDLAYIDANHRFEPTLNYFSQLLAKTHEQSILIFDDIHWSFGMRKAWKAIIQHPQVTLSVDLFDAGLVFFRPLATRQHYFLMF
ncbi:O-methyltransferase [Tunicatimonas pelagia]|uniref:O-methyltransferase n=1 Tax=Tunicatimonas pelagia TaxID=931531 RepID=UPI0026655354|nr:class I SAM-dependent methyltransferase [Tunicatimonas pelagia]WKN40586.1 class I SAM-dependent methyltransferase [Tunicatimonas pelagia]